MIPKSNGGTWSTFANTYGVSCSYRYDGADDYVNTHTLARTIYFPVTGTYTFYLQCDNTGYITEGQFYLKGGRIEPFGSLSRLKQMVNGKTREDHRAIMDGMIKLFAAYRDTLEKKSMGFQMTAWDRKLLKYGELFESRMMDLSVNIPLEKALDEGWRILADCFEPRETGLRTDLIQKFWPAGTSGGTAAGTTA
jgi:V/A-type H+-transporting ATPase subunit B